MNYKNRKKIRVINTPMREKLNKTRRAKDLGVSRASLYYKPKRETIDEGIKVKILKVLVKHKSYGHKKDSFGAKTQQEKNLTGYEKVWY